MDTPGQRSAHLHPTLDKLISSRSGNVTMVFGLSLLVLSGAVGGAIDFARWHSAKTKMQATMDSASLAGARTLQLSPTADASLAIATAQQYFDRMRPADANAETPTFTITESGTVVRGTANFALPTPFLSLFGHATLRGSIVSESVIAAGGNAGSSLEISLMLDTTGSMSGQKIEDLKLAAKDLVDIIVWDDQSQNYSKVALAPFSARVNVGNYLTQLTDVQATKSFSGVTRHGRTCVTERTGPEAFTDEKPSSIGNRLRAYSGDTGTAARDNLGNYSSTGRCTVPNSGGVVIPEIMPLTNDKAALKARIDELPAAGFTAGQLGTAWAWYLLSPKWTGIWNGASLPGPYSQLTEIGPKGTPKLIKVAVLMTDGVYNTTGGSNSYADGSSEAQAISTNAVTICNNMKAAGIKVYTIGFQLGGNAVAINTMKQCASREANDPANNPSYYFQAESGDDLRSAFRQIALQLSTLRLRM
jgi:Flp pilus assembly protein TadG